MRRMFSEKQIIELAKQYGIDEEKLIEALNSLFSELGDSPIYGTLADLIYTMRDNGDIGYETPELYVHTIYGGFEKERLRLRHDR